jgi:O-antigen/teichoic acid export membrane protein
MRNRGWFPSIAALRGDAIGATLVSLVNDSATYLLGGVLLGAGNVILIPLYTRTLRPSEFGAYALVDVTILLLVAVTALKLDVSYLKWFAELEPVRRPELLGATLIAGLGASLLGGSILTAFIASPLSHAWLQLSGRSFAWYLLPIVALENLQTLLLTDLRARRSAFAYIAAPVVRLGFMILASYYLLVVRHTGLLGLFLGRLAGDLPCFLYLARNAISSVKLRFSGTLLRPMILFGLPLIWSALAVLLQDASGRYFLSRSAGIADVGILGAAIKIGAAFQILVGAPFGVAWGSALFQIVKRPNARVIYSKIFNYVCLVALNVALFLAIFAPSLVRIFVSQPYYSAAALLPFILLVRAMNVIEQPAAVGIYLAGRTGLFAGIYTAALLLNFLLLYILVPRFGAMGVACAWLVSSGAVPALELAIGQRFYPLKLNARLILPPVLAWALAMGYFRTQVWNLPHHQLLAPVLTAAFVAAGTALLLLSDLRWLHRERLPVGVHE